MLRLQKQQPSLWEAVLPPAVLRLNEELTTIDRLLNDERFLTPFYKGSIPVSGDRQCLLPLI